MGCRFQKVIETVYSNPEDMIRMAEAEAYAGFEPLFGPLGTLDFTGIEWIVISTETGKRKGKVDSRPEWVLDITRQAHEQGTRVFMKEYLLPIMGEERMVQELPPEFICSEEKIYG